MTRLFLLPLLGHFGLVLGLYVWLTIERQRAVRAGQTALGAFAHANADQGRARRIQRNLANQFELPMFAVFAAAVLIALGAVTLFDVVAAWIFLIGRIIHTAVQTLTDNVALRGQVFVINLLGVALLMGHLASIVVSG